jgi:hypothetical protein
MVSRVMRCASEVPLWVLFGVANKIVKVEPHRLGRKLEFLGNSHT